MIWRVPRIWEGGDVWILGGGPSVPEQFGIPNKVIQEVVKGGSPSLYSPYLSALHTKHVIGINVSYLIGDWMDMIFFGDSGFFLQNKEKLARYPGLKISSANAVQKAAWVKYTPPDTKHVLGISGNPKLVSWNHNSGAAAISIAVHTGAKRIILLGFDMKLDADMKQHWHDIYHAPKKVEPIFARHLLGFPEIAKDAERLGVEIINASPDSAIECFRKTTVKILLDEIKVKQTFFQETEI